MMWMSKPLYEGMPFCYMAIGVVSLSAGFFLKQGYWPAVCISAGLIFTTGGLVLWLKRRDYRSSRSRTAFKNTL